MHVLQKYKVLPCVPPILEASEPIKIKIPPFLFLILPIIFFAKIICDIKFKLKKLKICVSDKFSNLLKAPSPALLTTPLIFLCSFFISSSI